MTNTSTPKNNEPLRALGIVGAILAALGFLALFLLVRGRADVPDWQRYSALGSVLVGGILYYLSTLPRDQAYEWVKSGAIALSVALVFRWAIGEPYRIPSGSMEPTLNGDPRVFRGDRVWVNKFWYGLRVPFMNARLFHWHAPERWDIVVFRTVEEDAKHPVLVKRIVGMPGERIHIQDGKVYANDVPLDVPEALEHVFYTSSGGMMRFGVRPDAEYAVVPEGNYLVLGDNSDMSRDGRYFGWLPNEHIVGRVASVWWPPRSWQDFTGFTQTLWWRGAVLLLIVGTISRMLLGRSFPIMRAGGKVERYLVSFVHIGLRIPIWGRYILRWRAPRSGDIAVFAIQGEDIPDGAMVLGRVAAVPGDKVTFKDGTLRVNDVALSEHLAMAALEYKELAPPTGKNKAKASSATLAPSEYYMVCLDADDEQPYDSRTLGGVKLGDVVGIAVARWWPLGSAGKAR